MNTALATQQQNAALLEQVVVKGDLKDLNPNDRVQYYAAVCQSVGLNPLTKPFEYITLNGKLTLYAKRDATDQLRAIKGISIQIVGRDLVGEIYIVTARATCAGREDEATGAVNIAGLKGEALANAYMKAETKAKRRVTLSIAGLGLLDETEIEGADEFTHSSAPVVQMPRAIEEPKAEASAGHPPEATDQRAPAKAGGRSSSATLNATQVKLIRRKCEDNGGPSAEDAICAHFGVTKLEEIPAAEVNNALALAEKGE